MKKIVTFALFDDDADIIYQALDMAYITAVNPSVCKRILLAKRSLEVSRCEHDFNSVLASLFEGGDEGGDKK